MVFLSKKTLSKGCLALLSVTLISCASNGHHQVYNQQPISPYKVPQRQPNTTYLDFLALGDTGTGGEGQTQVAKAMAETATQTPMAFSLLLGDNFYEFGVPSDEDAAWENKFEAIYDHPSLKIPFYAVLGNHDHLGNAKAQLSYAASHSQTRWKMPGPYYSFSKVIDDQNSIQFFALDTNPISNPLYSDKEQIKWLNTQLESSKARWKIVYGHHPLYSNGQHGNNAEMQKAIEPLLTKYKVDLYLAGHDHNLEMLKPQKGVNYVVSGAGAKSRDVHWRDNTLYAATNFGFTSFRVSKREMVIRFIRGTGKQEFSYTIFKPEV